MKKRNLICGAVCLTLAGSMVLSSCGKRGKTRDSETTPLVVSSEALDSVFNPYFYTTGPDGNVVGQTQIGMLSTDKDGNLVCGENEPCVVLDYATAMKNITPTTGLPSKTESSFPTAAI